MSCKKGIPGLHLWLLLMYNPGEKTTWRISMIFDKFNILVLCALALFAGVFVTGCVSQGATNDAGAESTPTPKPTPTSELETEATPAPTSVPTPESTPARTPKPSPLPKLPGASWLNPDEITVSINEKFSTEIIGNSGTKKLNAYGYSLVYDKAIIALDTAKGTSGVEAGPDGYVSAINANEAGRLVIAGFDVNGKGPGTNLKMLVVHWIAKASGSTEIVFAANNFNDSDGKLIGTLMTAGSTVTVE